ncbi:MAG: hypothetical protein GEV03_03355 [Streptosporangiales bacterium]|nr:hypothetical protein [Streptosporangiales bacterium]
MSLVAVAAGLVLNVTPATRDAEAAPPQQQPVVRLAAVNALQFGGLGNQLVADFEQRTGYRVTVFIGTAGEVFAQAGAGDADIVMTHWGFTELENFVSEGRGKWPKMIFSNSTGTFIIPPNDPAGVRDVTDPVQAFERIAESESPFVVNDIGQIRYTTDTLWNAAGRPDREGWYLDLGLSGPAAMQEAAGRGGYTIWGLQPFLGMQGSLPEPLPLEPVVFQDSMLQRSISSVVVNRPLSRNVRGALAFERYLLELATQARIRAVSVPNVEGPVMWPAGNQNDND